MNALLNLIKPWNDYRKVGLKNEIDNLDAENRKKYKSPYTIGYIYAFLK